VAFVVIVLTSCQSGPTTHPVPSVATIGSNLACATGDHGLADPQAGWGFCYPGTWRYNERSQPISSPPGLDLVFDITVCTHIDPAIACNAPCDQPSTAPGQPSPTPICAPDAGQFGVVIVSTYERGSSTSLNSWLQANGKDVPIRASTVLSPIQWGDSTEAYKMDDGRRIALTAHHVVVLDLHFGQGQLDLEALMSARLSTWKFTF
jgi:hypothetical protein